MSGPTAGLSSSEALSLTFMANGIGIIRFLQSDKNAAAPWGTKLYEHRLNLETLAAFNKALDEVEANLRCRGLVVTGEGEFFCNGFDLQWVDKAAASKEYPTKTDRGLAIQATTEILLARILSFPLPTLAALNGHACAGGAMLALAFDYRIALQNVTARRWMFVPGLDLGLIYSTAMTQLIKAKVSPDLHRDIICFSKRFTLEELAAHHSKVIDELTRGNDLTKAALDFMNNNVLLEKVYGQSRFADAKYRNTLQGIKKKVYKEALTELTRSAEGYIEDLGFEEGRWGSEGKLDIKAKQKSRL